jgi:hypothetical protein
MFNATRYEITKRHITGNLAGLTSTTTSGVEMPLGEYVEVGTGNRIEVVECRMVIDYLGRSVAA